MADEADNADRTNEIFIRAAIKAVKSGIDSPVATGFCLFCEAPVTETVRWCGPECRDDWQKLNNY